MTDGIVLKKLYQDSVKLMLLSRKLRDLEGVEEASVVMASAGNKEILEAAGLLSDKVRAAGPDDIVIALSAGERVLRRRERRVAGRLVPADRAGASRSAARPKSRPAASGGPGSACPTRIWR